MRRQQQQYQDDDFADSYEDENQDMREGLMEVEGLAAPISTDANKHASLDKFDSAKEITFHINIVASPEQLAQGLVSNKWSLKQELLKHLKNNTALANRLHATEEDLKGDLRQCIPLGFEVTEHANSFPYAMGFNVPGVMPMIISEHGAWVHRTAGKMPGCPTNGQVRFEPTNIIDRALLTRSQQTTRRDLESDIKLEKDYGLVKVRSPAYFKMVDALEGGEWADVDMSEEEYMGIVAPSAHARVVQVPLEIASTLKENLEAPIKDFQQRCINLQDFEIVVERADGNTEFNSPHGYIGEQIGADIDPDDELPHEASNTCQQYHASCKLTFALSE